MKPYEYSIVLRGKWNINIFTPKWIMNELLSMSDQSKLEMQISKETLGKIYKYKFLYIIPNEDFIEIKIENFEIENLKFGSEIALKIIELLPYTPGLKLGFNFKYTISKRLKFEKFEPFTKEFELNNIGFKKNFENYELNLKLVDLDSDSDLISFNFHYENITLIEESSINDHYIFTKEYLENEGL